MDGHDHQTDLVSYDLLKRRTIYITGEITSVLALSVISQLRYLAAKSKSDIKIFINSPGGNVSDGLAIYDLIKHGINCDVVTIATGLTGSMAVILLVAGSVGKRYATLNSEIMIHQPLGSAQGQATDILLVAEHIQNVKKRLAHILAEACNKPLEQMMIDIDRDLWMNSQQAKDFGLIDHIGYPKED
jgi:ATP-dependent Clp protease protease subunit